MSADQLIAAHRAAGRHFRAGGISSFLRAEGSGDAVVCLHGIPASSFAYRKVLPELARRGLRGIAFDLPGFGLADRPEHFSYGPEAHGAWVVEALDALGLDAFHLVLHDYGGVVGAEVLTRCPERVRSLTLLNAVLDVARFHRPAAVGTLLRPGPSDLVLRTLPAALWHRAMLRVGVLDPASLSRPESDAWLQLIRLGDHGRSILRTARGVDDVAAATGERYAGAVRALTVPRQLIWATSDPVLPLEREGAITHALTGGELHEVPGRHVLQEEQYETIGWRVAELADVARVARVGRVHPDGMVVAEALRG